MPTTSKRDTQYDNYSDIVLEVNTSKLATTLVQVLKQSQMLPASQHWEINWSEHNSSSHWHTADSFQTTSLRLLPFEVLHTWYLLQLMLNHFCNCYEMQSYGTCHKKLYKIRGLPASVIRSFSVALSRISVESSKGFRGIIKGYPQICRRASAQSSKASVKSYCIPRVVKG